jgi:hypothetical protein
VHVACECRTYRDTGLNFREDSPSHCRSPLRFVPLFSRVVGPWPWTLPGPSQVAAMSEGAPPALGLGGSTGTFAFTLNCIPCLHRTHSYLFFLST